MNRGNYLPQKYDEIMIMYNSLSISREKMTFFSRLHRVEKREFSHIVCFFSAEKLYIIIISSYSWGRQFSLFNLLFAFLLPLEQVVKESVDIRKQRKLVSGRYRIIHKADKCVGVHSKLGMMSNRNLTLFYV